MCVYFTCISTYIYSHEQIEGSNRSLTRGRNQTGSGVGRFVPETYVYHTSSPKMSLKSSYKVSGKARWEETVRKPTIIPYKADMDSLQACKWAVLVPFNLPCFYGNLRLKRHTWHRQHSWTPDFLESTPLFTQHATHFHFIQLSKYILKPLWTYLTYCMFMWI